MARFFNTHTFLAWILSLPVAYLVAGLLGNYYSTFISIVIITLVVHIASGWLVQDMLETAGRLYKSKPRDFFVALVLFISLAAFVTGTFFMALRFPSLFKDGIVLVEEEQWVPFFLGCALAGSSLVWLLEKYNVRQAGLPYFMHRASMGLLLAGFFFVAYFMIASIFNQWIFDVDDIFFDSDGLLWRTRLTTADYHDYYWRSVHPYVLLLLRPPVALLSFFIRGDRLVAAFMWTAFAGALCVFLAWVFVLRITANSLYAAMIASLLGVTAAHLVFGSLLETYIFLAAIMLIFLVMLARDAPTPALIVAGLASFGVTLTNFVQVIVAFIFFKQDFRQSIKYGAIVAALAFLLTMLNNFIYPNSQPYFFIPSTLEAEADNTFTPSSARALAVLRVMLFHGIVAPDPLILKEEIPFFKVWIFKAADPMRLSEYRTWQGTALAIFWLSLLFLGGYRFLKNPRTESDSFSLAFIVILLFNFLLHLRYGKELFLYSTNWTYALILLLAIYWRRFSNATWFQVVLMLFIILLMINNSRLIETMLATSALSIK